jgi:uncharacterized membrane protein
MQENTVNIIYKWLKQSHYDVSIEKIQLQFLSHPDIGTLSSITDTLNAFKIENQAAQIDIGNIPNLKEPFLSLIRNNKVDQFVLTKVISTVSVEIYTGQEKSFSISFDNFKKIFLGIIVVIDKQKPTLHLKIYNWLKPSSLSLLAFTVFFLFWLQSTQTINIYAYLLLTIAGLTCSYLLFVHSLGFNNHFLQRFCTLSKNTDCGQVLHSKAANLGKDINLTDVGIVYFSVQLIYLLLLPNVISILLAVSIVGILFPIYSIYQQAYIIKKWCPLCLTIAAILLLQGIVAIISISEIFFQPRFIAGVLCITALVCIVWHYLKKLFENSARLHNTEIECLSFKRNYHLFITYYKLTNPIEDSRIKKEKEIIIGSEQAPIQITLISNPLCPACQKAHSELKSFLQQFPANISLRIVFFVPYHNTHDPGTMIASWLVHTYFNNKEKGIKTIENWYANPNFKEFDKLKLLSDIVKQQQPFLQNQAQWCVQQRLTLTPLLLINNKIFPLIYRTNDLRFHIEAIIEFEHTKEYEKRGQFNQKRC